MSQRSYYWYHVMYSDARGVCHTKEGDIGANNVLHAAKRIEDWNHTQWQGRLIYLRLFPIDFESGEVDDAPCLQWTRHGQHGENLQSMDFDESKQPAKKKSPIYLGSDMDWDPSDWDGKQKKSQGVTGYADASFMPSTLSQSKWFKPHQSFPTMTLKSKEN